MDAAPSSPTFDLQIRIDLRSLKGPPFMPGPDPMSAVMSALVPPGPSGPKESSIMIWTRKREQERERERARRRWRRNGEWSREKKVFTDKPDRKEAKKEGCCYSPNSLTCSMGYFSSSFRVCVTLPWIGIPIALHKKNTTEWHQWDYILVPLVIIYWNLLAKLLIILQEDYRIFALHHFAIGGLIFLLLRWHPSKTLTPTVGEELKFYQADRRLETAWLEHRWSKRKPHQHNTNETCVACCVDLCPPPFFRWTIFMARWEPFHQHFCGAEIRPQNAGDFETPSSFSHKRTWPFLGLLSCQLLGGGLLFASIEKSMSCLQERKF